MTFTDRIIVLLRTDFREADRMVCAYSQEHGRIMLRFPGVNRSASKLRAISEPLAKTSARIYIRRGATIGCVTGGKIETIHPGLRSDYNKMQLATHFCELFYRLTPDANPNPDKFALLETSLNDLQNSPLNPGMAPAFLLRLMQLSGYGLQDMPVLGIDAAFWHALHTTPLGRLSFETAADIVALNKTRHVCQRFLARYLNYPLHTSAQLELTAPLAVEELLAETALEPAPAH